MLINKTEEATILMEDLKQEENSPERIFSLANISVRVSQSVPPSPNSDHKSRINLYDTNCKDNITDSTSWSYYCIHLNIEMAAKNNEMSDVKQKSNSPARAFSLSRAALSQGGKVQQAIFSDV